MRDGGVTSRYLPKNVHGRGSSPNIEAVPAAGAHVHLAGAQRHAHRLRHPPPLEQLGLRPRLEHEARGRVERSRDDDLAIGLPLHRRAFHRRTHFLFLRPSGLLLPFEFVDDLVQLVEARVPELVVPRRSTPSPPRDGAGRSGSVRTRPTFSVVTSPACSSTPTCFFMPVRVMSNLSARSVIEASRAAELLEDAAAGGVRQGGERGVEVGRANTEPYGSVWRSRRRARNHSVFSVSIGSMPAARRAGT